MIMMPRQQLDVDDDFKAQLEIKRGNEEAEQSEELTGARMVLTMTFEVET